jgi:Tol biopolymer transport system component
MSYILLVNKILIAIVLITLLACNSCFAEDGKSKNNIEGRIVFSYGRDTLSVLDLSNLKQTKIDLSYENTSIKFPSYPSWSVDGVNILFAHYRNNKGIISVANYDTNNIKIIVDLELDCDYPSWSPNNKYIAFLGRSLTGKADYRLYLYSFDSKSYSQILTEPVGSFRPTWSPDNSKIAFTNLDNQLVIIDLVKGQTSCLVKYGVAPSWSPDGKYILYRGRHHVYLYSFENMKSQRIIRNWGRTDIRNFSWSPDSSYFIFQTLTDRKSPLEIFSITDQKRIKLSKFGNLRGFDWN